MSEPKSISPLLDGFLMGSPMSSHDGIICCPAIQENTDQKYIVKIISIPATQAQMDALLLAGAYKILRMRWNISAKVVRLSWRKPKS